MSRFSHKSKTVSVIKRRLIFLLTALAPVLVWYYLAVVRPWDISLQLTANLQKKLPDYEFQNLNISEVSGAKIFYRVSADSLTLDQTQGLLERVTGSILENNAPALNFTAHTGVLEVKRRIFTFHTFAAQTVKRARRQIWTIVAPLAYWDNNAQNFTFDRRPRLSTGDIIISASKMVYNLLFDIFIIDSECEVTKGPYTLKGEQAVLKNSIDVLTVEKNVVLSAPEFVLQADVLDWTILKDDLAFRGNIVLRTKDVVMTAMTAALNTKSEQIWLRRDVRLQDVSASHNILVNTDRALWDHKAGRIEFFENTRAFENDSLIQSEKLIYDLAKNNIVAVGGGRTKIIRSGG